MAGKTALVFGATGLVGGELLKRLVQDPVYTKVKIFVRRNPKIKDDKLEVYIIDLDHPELFENNIYGDVLFCCLGTTIKTAGSKERFRKVDFESPARLAGIANRNGVPDFLVISSIGANGKSSNFYLKTKGEMELAVGKHKFQKLAILRPSLLIGTREEFRAGELTGKVIMKLIKPFLFGPLKRYKPVKGSSVATAMIKIAAGKNGFKVYESEEIELIGGSSY
jgi:uncharacterized protein YbjT (DUF2867 family)